MAVRAQRVVLRLHHAAQRAHEDAALAHEVARHLLLERRREEVARADRDADREREVARLARRILRHGVGRVDARAVQEVAAHVRARALRRDHDDVHVRTRLHARELVVDVREAVREVERLARRHVLLDLLPDIADRTIGGEHHDDVALLGGLLDGEERLAGHPAVLEQRIELLVRVVRVVAGEFLFRGLSHRFGQNLLDMRLIQHAARFRRHFVRHRAPLLVQFFDIAMPGDAKIPLFPLWEFFGLFRLRKTKTPTSFPCGKGSADSSSLLYIRRARPLSDGPGHDNSSGLRSGESLLRARILPSPGALLRNGGLSSRRHSPLRYGLTHTVPCVQGDSHPFSFFTDA